MKTLFNHVAPKALLTCLLITFSSIAMADISVIVHPSVNETASSNDIERIFLGKSKKLSGGTKLIPINLESGNAVRDSFGDKVLKKSDSQLKSHWSRLVFTGKAQPPTEVSSEADVLELIKDNPNMIGYVSSAAVSGDVKVIATF